MLWLWLRALLQVKTEEIGRQMRWGRSPANRAEMPWSTRKRVFGCLWVVVIVPSAWMVVFAAVGVASFALEDRCPKEDLVKYLTMALLIGIGLSLVLGTAYVYSATDKGRLPGTRDHFPETEAEREGKPRDLR